MTFFISTRFYLIPMASTSLYGRSNYMQGSMHYIMTHPFPCSILSLSLTDMHVAWSRSVLTTCIMQIIILQLLQYDDRAFGLLQNTHCQSMVQQLQQ